MDHLRGAFSKHLAPGYRRVLFLNFKEREVKGRALVNFNTSSRAYEEDFPVEGFGPMAMKFESGPVTYDTLIEGDAKRYLFTAFSKAWRITEELMEDNLYGTFGNKMSAAAGRSARNNVEVIMHAPYNNAFTSTVNGFVSGEALCDTHVSLHGVSQTNFIASDLDILSLQAGIEHFGALLGPEGFPVTIEPKLLVHSIGDQWLVKQLLKSTGLPGTNQNDINPVKDEGLTGHMHHGLILDPDDWFIVGDSHNVNYFQRRPLVMKSGDDLDTGDAKFRARQRHGSGFGFWQGIFGGQGQ